jgi:hypothetical protein
VLFFDWNSSAIVGGHQPASYWRCGFQICEQERSGLDCCRAAVVVADSFVVWRARQYDNLS